MPKLETIPMFSDIMFGACEDDVAEVQSTSRYTASHYDWISFRADRSLIPDRINAFVDGSTSGWHSAVLVQPGEWVRYLCRYRKRTKTRNVGAEVNAYLLALDYLPEGSRIAVVHDYLGTGAWSKGYWNINRAEIRKKIDVAHKLEILNNLDVIFIHHKGHQKDKSDFTKYNCLADWLCSDGHDGSIENVLVNWQERDSLWSSNGHG